MTKVINNNDNYGYRENNFIGTDRIYIKKKDLI